MNMILYGSKSMTITEEMAEKKRSKESFNCVHTLKILPALALLAVSHNTYALPCNVVGDVKYEYVDASAYSTNHFSELEYIMQSDEYKLFQAINSVYDDLLENQKELDAEAKNILYDNLWDLYE